MAAKVVAKFFETHPWHEGGCYDKYVVTDGTGRKWTLMSDSSIACTHKNGAAASRSYSVEFVSPICTYGDIPVIQQLVRDLRAAGGVPVVKSWHGIPLISTVSKLDSGHVILQPESTFISTPSRTTPRNCGIWSISWRARRT